MVMINKSWIEKTAERLKLIKPLETGDGEALPRLSVTDLQGFPPPERWRDWEEYDAGAWPLKKKKHYQIIPTTCFNCESACGMVAYVDKETGSVRKFEGNPYHPASRGRNCAKGPATINQINDPERILYPLRRKGARGSGQWERVSWGEVLDDIAGRIRKAIQEERRNEVVYHVGRPGHEGYMDRVLKSWGVDGHNSHTNICSAGARLGYALWQGIDRPSPDYANARFILLISSHLETGHYFNPHAQRIMEGMQAGAELAVMDPRLSNTASMARYWMPTYPGSEAAVLLAMARVILAEGLYNREFLENWVNWRAYMGAHHPRAPQQFESFIEKLLEHYAEFTPAYAAAEAQVDEETIVSVARRIGAAGTRFACHNWRSASSGNLGGWQVARCLHFLSVLTGSVGTVGGTLPAAWSKFKPTLFDNPPAQKLWNELHFPDEYPLAHFEMSPILPHMIKDGRGRIDVYFTRVFNPVWTFPDGFSWIETLREEKYFGCHIALTPTWNETAYYADYVLPMGHASERHDLNSYETHAGMWIAFRQPVLRRFAEENGQAVEFTYQVNPGEVWEEDEFWIELSWRIDPDGSLGIREHFLSPYRKGEKITVEEYYRYIFEHTPGLPEAAQAEGMSPLAYMCHYGAFEISSNVYEKHNTVLDKKTLQGTQTDQASGLITRDGAPTGVMARGEPREGFPTPSRLQEFYSPTMEEWGWPEYALPGYIKSHIHPEKLARDKHEYVLVPTFRLPNLIHSRSGNAKWLVEIAHRNPIWIHTSMAEALGVGTGDLLKVNTDIGYFIDKVWVTEAIKPGVVACSHHIGRWQLDGGQKGNQWMANTVRLEEGGGKWRMHTVTGVQPFASDDPDSRRMFWRDGGVHQNITHAVHPDPVSGMHCWHQRVRLEKPGPEEKYGDILVDTKRSFAVYKEWLEMTRPPRRADGLRRPLWLGRPLRPADEAFYKTPRTDAAD
ncbi:MAG: molybdopterin-dependent oxidoreductase [SAR324 cluster bacterium]|nr:molybdopterin-dependent oxidoreductase [SAR324 cluster bacterium]